MSMQVITAGRRAAQKLMVDTCTIRALTRSETLDEHTGEFLLVPVPGMPDPVYQGPCRLTIAAVQVQDVDSQGQDLAVESAVLSIPIGAAGSALVGKDQIATITVAAYDSGIVTAVVQASRVQTIATARRFPVEITT